MPFLDQPIKDIFYGTITDVQCSFPHGTKIS